MSQAKHTPLNVMARFMRAIHVFLCVGSKDVDDPDKPGHDAQIEI